MLVAPPWFYQGSELISPQQPKQKPARQQPHDLLQTADGHRSKSGLEVEVEVEGSVETTEISWIILEAANQQAEVSGGQMGSAHHHLHNSNVFNMGRKTKP